MQYNKDIKELKRLCDSTPSNKETIDGRMLILNYILYNKGILIPEIITIPITNLHSYATNLDIIKSYFKSFTDE